MCFQKLDIGAFAPGNLEPGTPLAVIDRVIGEHSLTAGQLGNIPDWPARVLAMATVLSRTVIDAPDLAFASIQYHRHRAPYWHRHGVDTAILIALLSRAGTVGGMPLHSLMAAALSMNVGMSEELSLQIAHTGALNEAEWSAVRHHPQDSERLLRLAGVRDRVWLDAVLHHHENRDGRGYLGVDFNVMSQGAQLLALADRFCARISARPHQAPLSPCRALKNIVDEEGSHIDPGWIAYLIRRLGYYPVGTLVQIGNGELAMVSRPGRDLHQPQVHSLAGPDGNALPRAVLRNSEYSLYAIKRLASTHELGMPIDLSHIWGGGAHISARHPAVTPG